MNRLYQLYDEKSRVTAGPIMIEKRDGVAIRTFRELCSSKDNIVGKYPADFSMLFLGTQDEESGLVVHPDGGPVRIDSGAAFLELMESSGA